ncbi:hypothetical protein E2C01_095939 [Portunus trituberculatus]|uniref:Uncharacterized protein n=1 Tax=Portunus trituberculatus TaxID=210409 RepID=A0A5B7K0P3_PORTR|nr:hypothetical protein [Portunus trituberculatus]
MCDESTTEATLLSPSRLLHSYDWYLRL